MITRLTDKKNTYENIFFDVDGTIMESGPGIINALRYMFDKIGYEQPDEAHLRAFIGPPVVHHLTSVYGFSDADARAAYAVYREYYVERGIFEGTLYPCIEDVLHTLAEDNKTLYVATSKPESMAITILEHVGVIGLFAHIFGAVQHEGVYTKDEVLTRAVTTLGGTPDSSVMIGDRYHDVLGGQHVHMDTIGALYGYGSFEELKNAGCDMIAEQPGDLITLLTEEDG